MEVASKSLESEKTFSTKEFLKRVVHYSKGSSIYNLPVASSKFPIFLLKKKVFRYGYNLPYGLYDEHSHEQVVEGILPSFATLPYAQLIFNIGPGVFQNADEAIKTAKKWGFECIENTCHILNTKVPKETIFEGFNATRKKHIKRYLKSGALKVFRTKDPHYFSAYFQLYEASAKRWGSSTTYSREFLSDLFNIPGIYMWVAEHEGKMLSGMICFYHEKSVFDWLAASLINDNVKKMYPAVAVQYEVIRHATENGYSYVNMGASKDLNGVSDFKDSWGATAQKTYTFVRRKGVFAAIKRIQGRLNR